MSFSHNSFYNNKNDFYETNQKYKRKFYELRNVIKDYALENTALCDMIADVQEKILVVREERKFLLKKLGQYEPTIDVDLARNNVNNNSATNEPSKKRKRLSTDIEHKSPKQRKTPSKVRKKVVQPIPLDGTGRPMFPIVLGGLTVHSLGEIITDRPEFHTEDVIYPVGFVSTRIYGSLKDPEKKCIYTCKISDDGNTPRFEIAADCDLDTPIAGPTADYCHTRLLQLINNTVQQQVVNTRPKGNEFFGISHPTILNLIQSSPGTRKCVNYKSIKFEVSKSAEAISEENDATLSYESLQRSIAFSKYHIIPDIKEEPPDETDNASTTLRELLMS